MDEEPGPHTLAEYPYVTVRLACLDCPRRRGRYRLANLAERFGARARLDRVLWELTKACPLQTPPGTKLRKYAAICRAHYADLISRPPPPDEPPDPAPTVVVGPPKLRIVG